MQRLTSCLVIALLGLAAPRPAAAEATIRFDTVDSAEVDTRRNSFVVTLIVTGIRRGGTALACTDGTPPDGFSTVGSDCDDDDDEVWALLTYTAIDEDGDGVTVPASGQLCTSGLPPPFRATPSGNDCDDEDPALTHIAVLYPDQDGDGIGATPRQLTCIGNEVPPGLSRGGYDEDDSDPAVIETDEEDELLELLVLGS